MELPGLMDEHSVTLHHGVLPDSVCAHLWEYFQGLEWTRIERAAMHLSRCFQNDNTHNEEAHRLVALLKSEGVDRYISFDDVSLVRYDNPMDYVDWHSDGGPLLQAGCAMGLLILGATRPIEFRRRGEDEPELVLMPASNDLIVERPGLQAEYQHRVPPVTEQEGLRFSIVLFTHCKTYGQR